MKILISHEFSGILREACRRLGHEAISCDLLPTEIPGAHYQGSVFDIIGQGFDAHVAFPPCTYVCSSGLHWNKRPAGIASGRAAKTEAALAHVERLRNAGVPLFAMENPVGCISTRWRKPDQKIQPYEFGENASKLTCLWLEGLPLLCPTGRFDGRVVTWKGKQVERWGNQCDSGQSNLGPSGEGEDSRGHLRSRTYPGIAAAMAAQWFGRVKVSVSFSGASVPVQEKQLTIELST